jgi:hypothetical protein
MAGTTGVGMGETIGVVRATAHRLGALASAEPAPILTEASGWSRLDVDGSVDGSAGGPARTDLGALSVAARAPACLLNVDDDGGLRLFAYGPDGSFIGPLDATSAGADVLSAVRLFGLPDGAAVLHRALTSESSSYDVATRVADACRALGLPLELLTPTGPDPVTVIGAPPGQPEVGVVLVYAPAVAAAADAPLTRQSAWTVPVDGLRSLHLWDGRGEPINLTMAAEVLAERRRPTLAYWWSERTAGFLLTRRNRVAGAHEWGGSAPVTPEGTASTGRQLADQFGVPEQALTVIALLRRTDRAPMEALTELGRLLDVPVDIVGWSAAELTDWAASVPGAVRTERLGFAAAVAHSVREDSVKPVRGAHYQHRPAWRRLLNGLLLLVSGPFTVFFVVSWIRGEGSGWWVLLGLLLTTEAASGIRPGRRSRMHINRGTTSAGGQ